MMSKRRASWVVALVLVASSPASAEPARTVRIASVAFSRGGQQVFAGIPEVVRSQGLLQRELAAQGVTLTWIPVGPADVGSTVNEAFAAGRIDFANYGDLPSIIANAAGIGTTVVVPSGRGLNAYLVVPPDARATRIEDLQGQRIALHRGRPWELAFRRLLDARGLRESDFRVLNLNPEAGAAALAAHKVDALFTLFDAFLLERRGAGKVIWSTAASPADWKVRAELWASRSFVRDNPALTQLVATAYVQAARWASDEQHREEVLALAARSGIPTELWSREYGAPGTLWKDQWSPLFDDSVAEHYRQAAQYAYEKGMVRTRLDATKLLDARFVTAALDRLGLRQFWNPCVLARTGGAVVCTAPPR
jgi:sulfonate transport system substrate-binding protein